MCQDPDANIPTAELIAEAQKALKEAVDLESAIIGHGRAIREDSKRAYGPDLMSARAVLMTTFARILIARNSVPGQTNKSRSDRLALIATFVQGLPPTEDLISEGQYAKATAVLKQDYEIVARLKEVRDGTAKGGETPNVKNAPEGSRHFYGDLNKVAHPSNPELLQHLLTRIDADVVKGLSPMPCLNSDLAKSLYELHVFTMLCVAREAFLLFFEMYPEKTDKDAVFPAMKSFMAAAQFAERAGFMAATLAPKG
jgi:hypothetical protein